MPSTARTSCAMRPKAMACWCRHCCPPGTMGFDAMLPPYPFDPTAARRLLGQAGPAEGLSLTLIAPEELEVQAAVVSKMLEQVGITVQRLLLNRVDFFQATNHYWFVSRRSRQQPVPWPTWDIALVDVRRREVSIPHSFCITSMCLAVPTIASTSPLPCASSTCSSGTPVRPRRSRPSSPRWSATRVIRRLSSSCTRPAALCREQRGQL